MQAPGAAPIDEFIASVGRGDNKAEAAFNAMAEFLEYIPVVGNAPKFGFDSLGGIGIDTLRGAAGAKPFDYTIGKAVKDIKKGGKSREKALYEFVTSKQFNSIARLLKIPIGPFTASLKQYVEQKEGKAKRSILSRITGKNAADYRAKRAKKEGYNPKILEDAFQFKQLRNKLFGGTARSS